MKSKIAHEYMQYVWVNRHEIVVAYVLRSLYLLSVKKITR